MFIVTAEVPEEINLSTPDQARELLTTLTNLLETAPADVSFSGDTEGLIEELPVALKNRFPDVFIAGPVDHRRPDYLFQVLGSENEVQAFQLVTAKRDPAVQFASVYTGALDQFDNTSYSYNIWVLDLDQIDEYTSYHHKADVYLRHRHADPNLPVILERTVKYEIWEDNNQSMFINRDDTPPAFGRPGLFKASIEEELKRSEERRISMSQFVIERQIEELEMVANNEPTDDNVPPKISDDRHEDLHATLFEEDELDEEELRATVEINRDLQAHMLDTRLGGAGLVSYDEAQALITILANS